MEGLGVSARLEADFFLGSLDLPYALDLKSTWSTRVMAETFVETLN